MRPSVDALRTGGEWSFATYHRAKGARGAQAGRSECRRTRDTNLDREVAIKILPELFASNPERVARFTRERKTLAAGYREAE